MSRQVNGYDIDLCQKCDEILSQRLRDTHAKVEIEFMKQLVHQPLAFKYHCE
jgi:hypothetical protein